MHEVTFLQDLAIVMIVAGLVTVLFHRLKQPVVLGYIIAGVIIGPHTPPFPLIADEETIRTLSELGVILLMFSLGLEFSLRKLREVGATALIAALSAIFLMIWAGYALGSAFGWNSMDSIFLGAILSISSTTIVIKTLEDLGKTKEKFARLIFGILIVEDILAIVMIALLSGFATTGSFTPADLGMTVLKLASFLVTLLLVGLIIVPRLLDYVAKFKSNEMLLVSVLGLCFGVSLLAVKLNYSVALGAFLIGAIIAEARQIHRIEALLEPVRDMFSAVFFVSIGLLINPALIWEHAVPIVIITAVVVVGQAVTCSFGTFVAGNDMRTSLRVGHGARADRRVFLHHCLARIVPERNQQVPLSDRGGRLRINGADFSLPHQEAPISWWTCSIERRPLSLRRISISIHVGSAISERPAGRTSPSIWSGNCRGRSD